MSSHKPVSLPFTHPTASSVSVQTIWGGLSPHWHKELCEFLETVRNMPHAGLHKTTLLAVYTHTLIGRVLTHRACRGHLIILPDIYFPVIQYQSLAHTATELSEMAAQLISRGPSKLHAHSWTLTVSLSPPQILMLIIVTTDKRKTKWEREKRETQSSLLPE